MILTAIAITSSIIYLAICWWLSRGLKRVTTSAPIADNCHSIDIIVSARNEELRLPALLKSLQKMDYPEDSFTITVVDDRSEDGTAAVVKEFQTSLSNLSLIQIKETPKGIAPKKHAIMEALKVTSGNLVLVTDADCLVQPQWLQSINGLFQDDSVGLVQGITLYDESVEIPKLLKRFQEVDFLSHGVVAAAGIGRELPINSNANNFAYRRAAYNELDGYGEKSGIVSGDDDLLLQSIWKSGKWNIVYQAIDGATVTTLPCNSWGELLNQRMRWGSKTVHYESKQKLVLGSIFIFYCLTVLQLLISIFTCSGFALLLTMLCIKIGGELFFMIPGSRIFKKSYLLKHAFWASPLQLLLVFLSIFGGVFGKFTWKGQDFSRELK